MKTDRKILYAIIVALTIALLICIFFLVKKKKETNLIPNTTQLLSTLTDMVYDDIDETLGNYEFYEWIKDDVDSFNIYAKQEPLYRTKEFKNLFKECAVYDGKINQQLFSLLNSIEDTESEEFQLLKELIDFVFITRLQRNKIKNFTLFDGVSARVFPVKDTISKGEEYTAYIEYYAAFLQTIPIMVIDGDTVPTKRNTQTFKEIPQKSGYIKHKGFITFNQQGSILELPFTIEYYVK